VVAFVSIAGLLPPSRARPVFCSRPQRPIGVEPGFSRPRRSPGTDLGGRNAAAARNPTTGIRTPSSILRGPHQHAGGRRPGRPPSPARCDLVSPGARCPTRGAVGLRRADLFPVVRQRPPRPWSIFVRQAERGNTLRPSRARGTGPPVDLDPPPLLPCPLGVPRGRIEFGSTTQRPPLVRDSMRSVGRDAKNAESAGRASPVPWCCSSFSGRWRTHWRRPRSALAANRPRHQLSLGLGPGPRTYLSILMSLGGPRRGDRGNHHRRRVVVVENIERAARPASRRRPPADVVCRTHRRNPSEPVAGPEPPTTVVGLFFAPLGIAHRWSWANSFLSGRSSPITQEAPSPIKNQPARFPYSPLRPWRDRLIPGRSWPSGRSLPGSARKQRLFRPARPDGCCRLLPPAAETAKNAPRDHWDAQRARGRGRWAGLRGMPFRRLGPGASSHA